MSRPTIAYNCRCDYLFHDIWAECRHLDACGRPSFDQSSIQRQHTPHPYGGRLTYSKLASTNSPTCKPLVPLPLTFKATCLHLSFRRRTYSILCSPPYTTATRQSHDWKTPIKIGAHSRQWMQRFALPALRPLALFSPLRIDFDSVLILACSFSLRALWSYRRSNLWTRVLRTMQSINTRLQKLRHNMPQPLQANSRADLDMGIKLLNTLFR